MLGRLVLHRKCGAFRFSDEQYCRFVKEVEGFCYTLISIRKRKHSKQDTAQHYICACPVRMVIRQRATALQTSAPFLDVYRKYRKLEEITRPMVVELIEKIEVYEGNRVEITFRFQDEIADLLEELHQKQLGQHEVSA